MFTDQHGFPECLRCRWPGGKTIKQIINMRKNPAAEVVRWFSAQSRASVAAPSVCLELAVLRVWTQKGRHGRDWELVSVTESLLVGEGWLPSGTAHRKKLKLAEGTSGMFSIHLKCPCANIPAVHNISCKPAESGDGESSWYHLSPSSHYLLGYETHWSTSLMAEWGQGLCVRLLPSAPRSGNSFKSFHDRIKQVSPRSSITNSFTEFF